jgi:predicted CoA-binding protein
MSGMACPMPTPPTPDENETIERILSRTKRIAVVGASDDDVKPGNYVPAYMLEQGYDVIGVNPNHDEVFGKKCYPSLDAVPGQIDLVNVFRRPLACADVTKQAIARGVKAVWLQSGIANAQAKKLAAEAGIDYIENRCIMVEHRRRR